MSLPIPSGDVQGALASQYAADQILIPCAVGWGLQIFLAGVATTRALPLVRRNSPHPSGVPYSRVLLLLAVVFNLLATATTHWEITAYMVSQERSSIDLNNYRLPDCIVPIPSALAGVCTQTFMAARCWKLIGRNWLFAVIVAAGIFSVLTGAIWSAVGDTLYMNGRSNMTPIFHASQLWLWANVFVDAVITLVLCINLAKRKKASSRSIRQPSDTLLIDSLIRIAFETCAAPLVVSVVSAIVYLATWEDQYSWNAVTATLPWISSLYVLSFVYCLEASTQTLSRARMAITTYPAADAEDAEGSERGRRGRRYRGDEGEEQRGIDHDLAGILTHAGNDVIGLTLSAEEEKRLAAPSTRRPKDSFCSDWEAPGGWETEQVLHKDWAAEDDDLEAASRSGRAGIEERDPTHAVTDNTIERASYNPVNSI